MSINLRSLLEQRLFPSRKWRNYILEEEKIRLQNRLQKPNVVQKIEEKVSEFAVTRKKNYKNFVVPSKTTILNIQGKGLIRQILITSPSNNFKIRVNVDNNDIVYDDFTNLMSLSSFTNEFDAIEDENGNYIFVMGDIGFKKKALVEIHANNVTFNYAEVVYNVIKK